MNYEQLLEYYQIVENTICDNITYARYDQNIPDLFMPSSPLEVREYLLEVFIMGELTADKECNSCVLQASQLKYFQRYFTPEILGVLRNCELCAARENRPIIQAAIETFQTKILPQYMQFMTRVIQANPFLYPGRIVNPHFSPAFLDWRRIKRHRMHVFRPHGSPDGLTDTIRSYDGYRVEGDVYTGTARMDVLSPIYAVVGYGRETCALAAESHVRRLKATVRGCLTRIRRYITLEDVVGRGRLLWSTLGHISDFTFGPDVPWKRFTHMTSRAAFQGSGTRVVSSHRVHEFFDDFQVKYEWMGDCPGFSRDWDTPGGEKFIKWLVARDRVLMGGPAVTALYDVYHRGEYFVVCTKTHRSKEPRDRIITYRLHPNSPHNLHRLGIDLEHFKSAVKCTRTPVEYERSTTISNRVQERLIAAYIWQVFDQRMSEYRTSQPGRRPVINPRQAYYQVWKYVVHERPSMPDTRTFLQISWCPEKRKRRVEILPPSPLSNNIAVGKGVKGEGSLGTPYLHTSITYEACQSFIYEQDYGKIARDMLKFLEQEQ